MIRHSKEQTVGLDALLSLPPRTVETLMLPFATSAEKMIYQHIEDRNTQRFMQLRGASPATVLGKYTELNGMLVSARQACGHTGVLHLDDLNNLNEKLEREQRIQNEIEQRARGHWHEIVAEKKENMTRVEVFNQAVAKARSSAKTRMREAVAEIQSSEIEFIECSICFDAITETDLALTVRCSAF